MILEHQKNSTTHASKDYPKPYIDSRLLKHKIDLLIQIIDNETSALQKNNFEHAEQWLNQKTNLIQDIELLLNQFRVKKSDLTQDLVKALSKLAEKTIEQAHLLEAMQDLQHQLILSIHKRFSKKLTYTPSAQMTLNRNDSNPIWLNRTL